MIKKELSLKIDEAIKNRNISEGEILKFLSLLTAGKQISTKKLITKTGQPETQIKRLLKIFGDFLEPTSKMVVVKLNCRKKMQIFVSKRTEQMIFNKGKKIRELLKRYEELRPVPDRNYDQFTATLKTTAKRALKMVKNGDIWDREIAFLGDDDLTSVAIGLTKQAKKITVFEIDERIVALINKISKNEGLNIEVVKLDLRMPLPKEQVNSFDVVFTDPPYTNNGVSLFLNRAIELIKNSCASRIYLCYGNSDRAREREVAIQGLISEKGLLINSKIYQFNKYQGAESIGGSSSLYLLDWTPKTKTTEVDGIKKFYTNE